MKFYSIISSIKKISQRFIHRKILDWFYIMMIFFLIGGIIIISVFTLMFLLHTSDAVIFVSDEEITSEVPSFNIAGLKIFASRFGMLIDNAATSEIQQQYKEEPSSTPVTLTHPPLSELKLRILNSTGIPGLAATWKKRFESEGLRQITIGNALEQDQKGIIVVYKQEKEIFLESIRGIIIQNKGVIAHENADDSISDDILILVGK